MLNLPAGTVKTNIKQQYIFWCWIRSCVEYYAISNLRCLSKFWKIV